MANANDLLADLSAIIGMERAAQAVDKLCQMGERQYRIGKQTRALDVLTASRLLAAGMTRAEARDVLISKGLSRRAAYRRMAEALNERGKQ